MKKISLEELKTHNSKESAWISIEGAVYDVTNFHKVHPGGSKLLQNYFGKEATEIFNYFHSDTLLKHKYEKLKIGYLDSV